MKKFSVKLALAALGIVCCLGLGGCGSEKADVNGNTGENGTEDQLAKPNKGDTIAVFHIKDYGDITVRLFPESAPKAVENFTTHAKEGYYDGVIFHRVIEDFMIQGGDPLGTGRGGESIWNKPFEDEIVDNLLPIRGALCMANSGPDTNGSQFFIVQAKQDNLNTVADGALTKEQEKKFKENGGSPHLVGGYTVFGQVIDGMDNVDKIAAVETDSNDKPLDDVVITSIEVKEYDK